MADRWASARLRITLALVYGRPGDHRRARRLRAKVLADAPLPQPPIWLGTS
ncbi:hypothetical protein [Nocardia noduli]|uniref:hypothetical protein n=1 Tax=Nocardia noduli TaxID=2815722 RepID=UPI001C224A54|nr:hypothetical protein [Nocardia noduli]